MTVQVSTIVAMVCGEFDVQPLELLSARRDRHLAHPRQVAMFLARRLTRRSYPELGRMFRRDHTTVLHAERVVSERLAADCFLAARVAVLTRALSPSTAGA